MKNKKQGPSDEARKMAHDILTDPRNKNKSEVDIVAEVLDMQSKFYARFIIIGIAIGVTGTIVMTLFMQATNG